MSEMRISDGTYHMERGINRNRQTLQLMDTVVVGEYRLTVEK